MLDGYYLAPGPRSAILLDYLGPAKVTAGLRDELEVSWDGKTQLVRLAVAGVYQPSVGDTVLVIAAESGGYVIGVLSAAAPATLQVPGDLRICAPHGTISLLASEIELGAQETRVRSSTLYITAGRLLQTFDEVRQVVRGLFDLDMGELTAAVRGLFDLAARRIRARAQADVQIDGESIHLG
jgi:hypothetical protein